MSPRLRLTFVPDDPEEVPSPRVWPLNRALERWLEALAARALQGDVEAAYALDRAGVSHARLAPIYRRLMVGGLS